MCSTNISTQSLPRYIYVDQEHLNKQKCCLHTIQTAHVYLSFHYTVFYLFVQHFFDSFSLFNAHLLSQGHYHNNRANCDKNMKFSSDVPYTKTVKKLREPIKAHKCIGSWEQKYPPWGFLHGKISKFPNITT